MNFSRSFLSLVLLPNVLGQSLFQNYSNCEFKLGIQKTNSNIDEFLLINQFGQTWMMSTSTISTNNSFTGGRHCLVYILYNFQIDKALDALSTFSQQTVQRENLVYVITLNDINELAVDLIRKTVGYTLVDISSNLVFLNPNVRKPNLNITALVSKTPSLKCMSTCLSPALTVMNEGNCDMELIYVKHLGKELNFTPSYLTTLKAVLLNGSGPIKYKSHINVAYYEPPKSHIPNSQIIHARTFNYDMVYCPIQHKMEDFSLRVWAKPFDTTTWSLLLLYFVFCLIVLGYKMCSTVIITAFIIMFRQFFPKLYTNKIAILLIYANLFLSIYYESVITTDVLVEPKEETVQTLHELIVNKEYNIVPQFADEDYYFELATNVSKLKLPAYYKRFYEELGVNIEARNITVVRKYMEKNTGWIFADILLDENKPKLGVLVEKENTVHYVEALSNIFYRRCFPIPEEVEKRTLNIVFSGYMVNMLYTKTQEFVQGGFFKYWKGLEKNYLVEFGKTLEMETTVEEPISISSKFITLFALWGIFLGFSKITLIIEVIYFQLKRYTKYYITKFNNQIRMIYGYFFGDLDVKKVHVYPFMK